MADFNDGGRMDIVGLLGQGYPGTTEQLVFFLADPNPGKFTTQLVNLPSHEFATNPVVGDFNRDTRPDVLVNEADIPNGTQSLLVAALNRTTGNRWSNCNYPRQGQAIALSALPIDSTSSPVNFSATASAFEPLRKIELWVDGNKIEQQDHTWNGSAWFIYTAAFSPGAARGYFLRSRHRQRPAATRLRLHRRPKSVRCAILARRQHLQARRLRHNVSSPRRGRRQHLRHSCPHGTLG